jgi:hypothetical protein
VGNNEKERFEAETAESYLRRRRVPPSPALETAPEPRAFSPAEAPSEASEALAAAGYDPRALDAEALRAFAKAVGSAALPALLSAAFRFGPEATARAIEAAESDYSAEIAEGTARDAREAARKAEAEASRAALAAEVARYALRDARDDEGYSERAEKAVSALVSALDSERAAALRELDALREAAEAETEAFRARSDAETLRG